MWHKAMFWWTWFTRLRGIVSFSTARKLVRKWHPTEKCHCGHPTTPRLTGTTRQWECVYGGCAYSRYEHLTHEQLLGITP